MRKRRTGILATTVAIAAMLTSTAAARTRTTQSQLRATNEPIEHISAIDNGNTPSDSTISQADVSLRGYNKRASDAKESFFITNNTSHRMSSVKLLLRYSTIDGTMLHERQATVDTDLRSGESKLVTISTFDVQRLFYYYAGPKPRKQATPFKVSYRLVGYSIPVGN